jgi:hypothetical protein
MFFVVTDNFDTLADLAVPALGHLVPTGLILHHSSEDLKSTKVIILHNNHATGICLELMKYTAMTNKNNKIK